MSAAETFGSESRLPRRAQLDYVERLSKEHAVLPEFPFEVLADEYDAVRAGYVPELIDDLLAFADLGDDARVLEVGCGPGTATRLIAPRVPRLTAVEPSARFVELVRRDLAGVRHVDVVHARFQDWDGPAESFDLLYGARSFQWVPAEARFAHTARLLRPGGTLALFWHWPVIEEGGFLAEVQDACDAAWPPREFGPARRGAPERVATWRARFAETESFAAPDVRRYGWTRTYDSETFVALMNTWPMHRHLPAGDRRRLDDEIRTVFARRGETVEAPYETALFLSRREV